MAEKTLFFRHTRTGKRYRVLRKYTQDDVTYVELKGELGTFSEKFDKERFKQLGYTLEIEEPTEDDDE